MSSITTYPIGPVMPFACPLNVGAGQGFSLVPSK
jgi:hypothetical protein